jgi:hypothetical protein
MSLVAQNGKLLIGVTFSPDYSYRHLSTSKKNATPYTQNIIDQRNAFESPILGFTSGVKILYKLKARWAIETGFGVSKRGNVFKIDNLIFFDPNDPLAGAKSKIKFSYYYLEIPIKMNYYITTGKIKLFASAGISGDLFMFGRTKQKVTFSDGHSQIYHSTSHAKFNSAALGIQTGLGAEYSVNDKFDMRIEPLYRRQVVVSGAYTIKEYFYSIGINFGVFYKL